MACHISLNENNQTKSKRCRFAPNRARSTAFFVFLIVISVQCANVSGLFARDVATAGMATTAGTTTAGTTPTDNSTIILTAALVTLFLMLVSAIVLSLDAPTRLKHSARLILCGFHLVAAISIGMAGPDALAFLFALMFALTAESLSFAGHAFTQIHNREPHLATDLNESVESVGDFDRETDLRLIHAATSLDKSGTMPDESGDAELSDEEGLPSGCTLSVQRFQTEDAEVYSGQARADFSGSSRSTSVHIAFCPPFKQTPSAEVFQIAGFNATIKTGMLERFGMRVDIRRLDDRVSDGANATCSTVEIEFVAQAARQMASVQVA